MPNSVKASGVTSKVTLLANPHSLSATVPRPMFPKPLLDTCWRTREHRTHISPLSGKYLDFSGCFRYIPPKLHVHWELPRDIKAREPSALFQASFPPGQEFSAVLVFSLGSFHLSHWIHTHLRVHAEVVSFSSKPPPSTCSSKFWVPPAPFYGHAFYKVLTWESEVATQQLVLWKDLMSCFGDQQALQISTELAMPPLIPSLSLFVCSNTSNLHIPPNNLLWNVCAHHY